ncbi:MAG: tRNA (adenosine(37)-N6)-threonylcarbamoyltransferase complex transferase subunit TsaD [Legionellales bacterium]|nr:tRNA (adenosine(37)-N6)-threonylcarbamoyltransferase complex transferase subunit TsaD [Legionellales bacterium]
MRVLGIETSCDDTGVAVYDDAEGLLAHALHSQITTHQRFGGVVPELASREHVTHLVPLVDEVLDRSKIRLAELNAVAYTNGPGLIGALLAGASFAKSLAFALQIPSIAVHHLEAHLLAASLEHPELHFPYLVLLVSGGHTELILAHALGQYELLGHTLDDAVGEAFDKTAKLMGIPYPGGAALAGLADAWDDQNEQLLPPFPRPMTHRPGLDFSFSGLKTHALTTWLQSTKDFSAKSAIAKAFQDAVVDTLLIKCRRALKQTACPRMVIAGGVGANRALRECLTQLMSELQGHVFFPRIEYCTDNGAMVAYAGCLHLLQGEKDATLAIDVKARWPL